MLFQYVVKANNVFISLKIAAGSTMRNQDNNIDNKEHADMANIVGILDPVNSHIKIRVFSMHKEQIHHLKM